MDYDAIESGQFYQLLAVDTRRNADGGLETAGKMDQTAEAANFAHLFNWQLGLCQQPLGLLDPQLVDQGGVVFSGVDFDLLAQVAGFIVEQLSGLLQRSGAVIFLNVFQNSQHRSCALVAVGLPVALVIGATAQQLSKKNFHVVGADRLGVFLVGVAFVKDAPLAIVVLGDETRTDLWVDNCSISATILQLAATALGLGSCWVHVHGRPRLASDPSAGNAEDYLRELLGVKDGMRILCVIAAGHPAEE